jgi:hypothetical protein
MWLEKPMASHISWSFSIGDFEQGCRFFSHMGPNMPISAVE